MLQGLLSKNYGNNQIGRSLLQSLWDGSLEEFKISKVVYSEDPPEEEVEEEGVEVDAADDRP